MTSLAGDLLSEISRAILRMKVIAKARAVASYTWSGMSNRVA
jgi:hypothetical protein